MRSRCLWESQGGCHDTDHVMVSHATNESTTTPCLNFGSVRSTLINFIVVHQWNMLQAQYTKQFDS